ncbi:MAG TPA: hypothetical protein IAB45_02435 [Candidatus Onthousia faecavium]|nr:hypothetical protein [Candidatus Onthousia faecavium]
MDENMGKKIVDEVVNASNNKTTNDQPTNNQSNDMRKKLMRIMLIVIGVLVIILIVILIISLFTGRNKSYEAIETELENAAKEYYDVQSGLLPQEEGEVVTVNASILAENGYMDPLSELRSGEDCTGRVEVTKINGEIIYTPYLECGDNYVTKELYKAVLEQGLVTTGNGLYDLNGEKVYRGETVNNYVKLDNALFRIVKIIANNQILLIADDVLDSSSLPYDDRYNSDRNYNSGINDYRVSRIKSSLEEIYNGNTLLSNNDKEKLTTFNLCIGKRSEEESINTNGAECSDVLNNQMIGLLTVSDFINASLDSNCKKTTDRSCQNYNYLRLRDAEWWLLTSNNSNTYQAYAVRTYGYIESFNASNMKRIRPTVMLNSNAMIKSGDGSASSPYILK